MKDEDKSVPNIAPKDWGANDPEGYAAFELFQVFKTHSIEGIVDHEGAFWMSQIFGRVPLENRARVFVQFLGLLNDAGIDYDKEQFNAEAVDHDLPRADA